MKFERPNLDCKRRTLSNNCNRDDQLAQRVVRFHELPYDGLTLELSGGEAVRLERNVRPRMQRRDRLQKSNFYFQR